MIAKIASALFLLCAPAFAAEMTVTASGAISGDEISLQDGRVLRLAGVKSLDATARDFLQNRVAGKSLTLLNAVIDRYGRLDAIATVQGAPQTVQDDMLQAGMDFVYPADGSGDDEWLSAERAARKAGAGAWPTHIDVPSDDAEKLYGSYGFVSGTVKKAERVKNKVYLNFGDDWRTDFTIAIAAHDLRKFKNADIDLLALAGQRLRARGWVKRDFGPMITVTDPQQIEIMN